jgi:hypothetical protein
VVPDVITPDAFGAEEVRLLWDDLHAPGLPFCERLERVDKRNIVAIVRSDPEHATRAWWERWIERTHDAAFLAHMRHGPPGLGWFVEDEERIARLLRGQYDREPKPKLTAAEESLQRAAEELLTTHVEQAEFFGGDDLEADPIATGALRMPSGESEMRRRA